jgi:hypothetical protein
MPRRSEMMRSARSGSERSRQSNDQFAGHTGLLFGALALHHRQARQRLDSGEINAAGLEGVFILQIYARQVQALAPVRGAMAGTSVYCSRAAVRGFARPW